MMNATTASATHTLVVERDLPHPPAKVWRALTQSALIAEWLLANDFAPSVGHKFNFRSPPMPQWNGIIDCEVLAIEPEKQLSYSWGALGLETVVTFTLTPSAAGTHLRMEQSGFGSKEDNNYRGATYGWQRFIGNLEGVLTRID
jgi:uncharacterized protein YndB with AHSA1/START domain